MTTIYDLLNEFTEAARTKRDKGDLFERLIANYLMTDPQYAELFSDVWLWGEWPYNWGGDDGIDIVAKERYTGNYWAIQCKFFDPEYTIQKSDIDSFFTASGKRFMTDEGERSFSNRMIVSTSDRWSQKAEEALNNQTIPVSRLRLRNLVESPIDWSKFSLSNIKDIRLRKKKELYPIQKEALEATVKGFQTSDRGKLIMACGTGKTITSLRIAEALTPENGRILFLAPSISLISQTLREWTAEATNSIHTFAVCSDSKVGKENEDIRTHDLAYPATTDASKLVNAVRTLSGNKRTVFFSTYQSIDVIENAQKMGLGEFDLIICDEAHRTVGITLKGENASDFVKVHDQNTIQGKKRLYMTATPRIYNDKTKEKAGERSAALYSMDDEAIYGPEFFRLGFGKSVQMDLLSEYKVLIVAVDDDQMAKLANDYNAYNVTGKKAIDIQFATKIIGAWKGLSKKGLIQVSEAGSEEIDEDIKPMRRAVAFSRSINDSKAITEIFSELVNMYSESHKDTDGMVHISIDHVDGGMNALKRQNALEWLKEIPEEGECRILSNARCLSEGIDVPALDAVIFFDTRESIVDIVQSVGRVMRKSKDGVKKYGYIILPVAIPFSQIKDYNSYIENDPQFKGIWKVLKALRAHDESLVDEAEFRRKVKITTVSVGKGEGWEGNVQGTLEFPVLPIDEIAEAVYGIIPKKFGDLEYWSDWAKDVAKIAERIILRICEMLSRKEARLAFDQFLKGIRDNLNPLVTEDEAIEMLAQHVITRPVFEALFEGYSFTKNNPVSKSMQSVIEILDNHDVNSEVEGLEKFYKSVKERALLAKSDKSRQDLIRNLYDTFFKSAFPRMADRLGIVYTPVEVVDFIIHSVEYALRKHFNTGLTDQGVQILDPFTGTGTFIARLLQSGLIRKEDLEFKYLNELHANEIVLLAYYIAAINIENAFHALTGEYRPFEGIVLTDTFQMSENKDWIDKQILPENSERVNRQKQQDIRVIIGNPPYSAQQKSANDNNQKITYPQLDASIRDTYAFKSKAKLVKNLYDSYVRAIRWASNRIGKKGVVAFVTNGSFIDGNNMDGLRKCLIEEYSSLYVFNLRGNARTQGEERRKEGGGIFGEGSRTPVAITVMIKDPAHQGLNKLYYYDIGDYLSREEKLAKIEEFKSISGINWKNIIPNEEGDWINQRDPMFERFIPLGDKKDHFSKAIFDVYSLGVVTARDSWVYNYSREKAEENTKNLIENYNKEVEKYVEATKGLSKEKYPKINDIVDFNPKKISWSRALLNDAKRRKKLQFENKSLVQGMYRPFAKQWMYFNRRLNEMVYQIPRLFPTPEHKNIVISVSGIGAGKSFSALVTDTVPNLDLHDKCQNFPLYWYEKVDDEIELFEVNIQKGYIRRDAITDWALNEFRGYYQDETITKEDLFWYVYGVLHSTEYRQRFEGTLKRILPRIPFAEDFWAYSKAGRKLGELHLNYETIEPYPLTELSELIMDAEKYRVTKMRFGKKNGKTDKSVIVYNEHLTLLGIPLEAYDYVVNGKSAIEWIMERYAVTVDKDSGIRNDPNDWSEDPRYIVDLLKRVVRVSIETQKIVNSLPPIGI